MCSDKGMNRVIEDPIGFSRYQWETWSSEGWFSEEDFDSAAHAWKHPDYAAITLNGYRSRWLSNELEDSRYSEVQARLHKVEQLHVPTPMIQGGSDLCDPPSESAGLEHRFKHSYERIVIPGVGHFPHREAPSLVADAILERL